MKAASRQAETPPAIRVRLSAELWDLVHQFPKENWSQVCRSAMERRARKLLAVSR